MSFTTMQILLLLVLFSLVWTDSKFCSMRDSCSNSSSSSPSIYNDEIFIQSRNCFCDSSCRQYDDCCDQSHKTHSHSYQCVDFLSPTMINRTLNIHPLSVWMREKCLLNYQGSPWDLRCRNVHQETFVDNPSLFIPVTSVHTKITYRNYFCAYCNHEANDQLVFWQLKVFCRTNGSQFDRIVFKDIEQIDYYIQNLTRNCSKIIRYPYIQGTNEPSVFIRPCKKTLPAICPSKTPIDLAQNCSSSGLKYRYDLLTKQIYPNPYCAQCMNPNNHSISCLDPIRSSAIPSMNQIRVQPLSILFDPNLLQRYINSNSSVELIYSLAYKCRKTNEVYELFRKKCSVMTYSNRERIISMRCQSPMQTLEKYLQYPNGSLYLFNQSILLRQDQYVFLSNEHLVFCADRWKDHRFPFYRNILSIICTSISLVCLVIFMITFCLIPSLQNLPGKCLLSLSISLFFGQLIFITTSNFFRYPSLCFLSSILIHYFYLSSFFWLLIIAIQIHSTFTRQTVEHNPIPHQHFHLSVYHLIVGCSTSFIILIACLIQLIYPQSNFSPAYGLLFCSISKPYALIIFFLIPIGFSLVLIAGLFFKTILAIFHSHQSTQLVNPNDRHFVFIYARLGCLMGLQWILLILALLIQRTWLWLIFEIINSLPGVFICLGFLYSQRIWMEMKVKLSKRWIHRRQSLKSNTISTSLMSPMK